MPPRTRDATEPVPGAPLTADALLRRHKRHWRHRGRDGAVVPFSQRSDPWIAFRTYRAISWVGHAERHVVDDIDAAFIFHWIAFDACYGTKDRTKESLLMSRFFGELLRQDGAGAIYDIVWRQFAGPVRAIVGDPYCFQPRIDELSGQRSVPDWRAEFRRKHGEVMSAIRYPKRTMTTLVEVFDRLYCLRNQLFHGGAKWGSTRNRESMRAGQAIMAFLVPFFVDLMMDARKTLSLGEPRYYLEGEGA